MLYIQAHMLYYAYLSLEVACSTPNMFSRSYLLMLILTDYKSVLALEQSALLSLRQYCLQHIHKTALRLLDSAFLSEII